MEPPSHPDTDDAQPFPRRESETNRVVRIIVGAVIAVVVVVLALHLTGVVGPLSK